jgi:hypothetical protein
VRRALVAMALLGLLCPLEGGAQILRVPPIRTVAGLGACTDGKPKMVAVTDGISTSDCSVGGGLTDTVCFCLDGTWTARGAGPQGEQGELGPQGPPGADGAAGPQGAAGAQGPAGAAATVTVGSTTTGAPGSSASVVNSGTSSAAVLDFTIPRGDVGATGPAGATGATGATGPAGPTGPQGPAGPVAGADTQVIFNDGGAAAGDTDLTWNKTTNKLTLGLLQTTISGDGQVFQGGGTSSLYPGFYRVGTRFDLNLANDGGMSDLGVQNLLGGSNHSAVSNTPSFRINSNGGGLVEVTSMGGIEWSSSATDARVSEDLTLRRAWPAVLQTNDSIRYTPRSTPPVTCGNAGTAGVEYFDSDSSTFCGCNGSTWISKGGPGPCN